MIDIVLGMLAPLVAVAASWLLIERTWRQRPDQLTAVMIAAFGAKLVFFGAYVAVMIKVVGVRPVPFVASFTAFFVGLYLLEALMMRRLFEES